VCGDARGACGIETTLSLLGEELSWMAVKVSHHFPLREVGALGCMPS